MNKKYMPLIFLLVAMLLVSFSSFAHDVKSGATKSSCACHLQFSGADEGGAQPDHCPVSHTDDCGDCEGCHPEVSEPALFCGLRLIVSVKQLFHQPANSFFSKVYLAIFVPPESCSLI